MFIFFFDYSRCCVVTIHRRLEVHLKSILNWCFPWSPSLSSQIPQNRTLLSFPLSPFFFIPQIPPYQSPFSFQYIQHLPSLPYPSLASLLPCLSVCLPARLSVCLSPLKSDQPTTTSTSYVLFTRLDRSRIKTSLAINSAPKLTLPLWLRQVGRCVYVLHGGDPTHRHTHTRTISFGSLSTVPPR